MSFLATIPVNKISTADGTIVKVSPPTNIFYTNATPVNATFKISIIAENIPSPGFYGWEFYLSWTPSLINCTTETINTAIWPLYSIWVTSPIDNTVGQYHQSMTARAPSTPQTGTYWLANLTFKIVKAPLLGQTLQTSLTVTPAAGATYCLADIEANEIPHDFGHGLYKYISPRPPLPPTEVKITPSSIFDPSLIPCNNFTVNASIVNAAFLHSFSLKLGYNATTIECLEVLEGDLLSKFGITSMTATIDNGAGVISVSINLTDPSRMADGNGTLTIFKFHVKEISDSILDLYDTQLWDSDLLPLPHTTKDGCFNNVLMPVIYVDPPLIINPSMQPSTQFQININVANVSDLYDFEFTLEYDTSVLNGLGVIVIPFDNEISFDLQFSLNDTAGRIWVKVQYYPPAQPLTTLEPRTIVKLFFQVQSYGATPLHFNQTELSNSLGQSVKHIAKDGLVSILRRDVAIVDITPEYYEAYKGWIIKVYITASNLGDMAETFNVTLYVNDNVVEEQEVVNLAPKTNITLTMTFNTAQPWVQPCHNHTLKAEASYVPYEIDTTNNILVDGEVHIKLMGDINGDKVVNYSDAILIGASFGSKPGDPNWNPNADLNRDGYINYKDVIILGANFGAVCP
jgi:hypothetical protein